MLPLNQNLCLVSGLLPLDFRTKILCAFVVFPVISINVWPDNLPTCFC